MTTAPLFPVAFFQNKSDAKPKPQGKTWAEFVQMFKRPTVRAGKDGMLFSPAKFMNGRRLNENVQSLSMLVLDFDHNAALAEALDICEGLGCDYLIYTTHSHRRVTDKHPIAEDCFRAVFPLREPIPPEDFPRLFKWAEMIFDHKIDKTPKGVAWMYYLPAIHSADSPYEIFSKTGANFLDWRKLIQGEMENGNHSQLTWGDATLRSAPLRSTSPPHTPQTDAEEKCVNANGLAKKRPPSSPSASVSAAGVSLPLTLEDITYDPSDDFGTWKAGLIVHISKHHLAKLNRSGRLDAPGLCHGSDSGTAVFCDPRISAVTCNKGCAITQIARSYGYPDPPKSKENQTGVKEVNNDNSKTKIPNEGVTWPRPLSDSALIGLAGELVRTVEPHTEADPAAILIQFLVGFGNVIGRSAYFKAEADRHYLNEFAVIVGATSKGRKGTSAGQVKARLGGADEQWGKNSITEGLSTGEGLIWNVRDSQGKEYGVDDKRLLVIESEFANILKVAKREGNTLSPVIRRAWDTGDLQSLTKNSPARVTDAHISIIGHVTKAELLRHLDETETANGFANRFLWICVKRSKVLPEGGNLNGETFTEFDKRLTEAIEFAQGVGEIKRDDAARALWFRVYPKLSEGKPGLFGAITGRAEAHVMRLASIYALLDQSDQIKEIHLRAALEVWRYSEDSVRHIFGMAIGDPLADQIISLLSEAGEAGITRTEITNDLGRNTKSAAITRALNLLAESGQARYVKEKAEGKGRSTEKWFAVAPKPYEINEINEINRESEENKGVKEKPQNYEINEINELSPQVEKTPSGEDGFISFSSFTSYFPSVPVTPLDSSPEGLSSFNSFISYTGEPETAPDSNNPPSEPDEEIAHIAPQEDATEPDPESDEAILDLVWDINAPSVLAAKESLEETGAVESDQMVDIRENLGVWKRQGLLRNGNGAATR